ncbi:MAG: cytochrome D ubiquinol oxidase subunit II, partial [Thermoguttaceae bacterium]
MRLQRRPGEALLESINTNFADILLEGRFQVGPALAEEQDDPDLADLPRLIFQFNRRNYGRLRQLIDSINSDPGL